MLTCALSLSNSGLMHFDRAVVVAAAAAATAGFAVVVVLLAL